MTRKRKTLAGVLAVAMIAAFLLRRVVPVPDLRPGFDPALFRNAPVITAEEARRYVGDRAVVCGQVVSTAFASATRGQPTFLNLNRPFPDQPFDLVIWGRNRGRFAGAPEDLYAEADICAAGRILEHQGVPRIEVMTPEQIRITGDQAPAGTTRP